MDRCFDQNYAGIKNGATSDAEPGIGEAAAVAEDVDSNSGKIIVKEAHLEIPAEIVRIRRGLVMFTAGGLGSAGMQSWRGVDLDRRLSIAVTRRHYDKRVLATKPIPDPVFSKKVNISFARKFSTDLITELEIVSVQRLEPPSAQAFVCIANAAWAAPTERLPDTYDAIVAVALLDEQRDGAKTMPYRKVISPNGPLDPILTEIWSTIQGGIGNDGQAITAR